MSLIEFNSLKSYWSTGSFLGHDNFKGTLSQHCFQLLEQFIRKSAAIVVPVGVSALDENSCLTKARTRAKTCTLPISCTGKLSIFMPLLAISIRISVPCLTTELGIEPGLKAYNDCHHLFRTLCIPYYNIIGSDASKDSLGDTPAALWICMM